MKNSNRVAIVATSPLQILLAHQICNLYDPTYVKCFIMTYNGDNRYEKCAKLSFEYGYDVQSIQMSDCSSRWMIIRNCLTSFIYNEGYDIVIQGMFTIVYFYSFSMTLLRNGGELIITDDGVGTFQLEDTKFMDNLINSRVYKSLDVIMNLRKIQHRLFYTIFNNVKSRYYDIRKLNFYSNKITHRPQGVYFLGTFKESYISSFNPPLTNEQFEKLIEITVEYIHDNFSRNKIFYTPHGRETEFNIRQICNTWNLDYLPTKISVEVDYPRNGYYPQVIIGFMSAALFTLKAIYPLAIVIDVRLEAPKIIYTNILEKINQTEDIMGISRVYVNV